MLRRSFLCHRPDYKNVTFAFYRSFSRISQHRLFKFCAFTVFLFDWYLWLAEDINLLFLLILWCTVARCLWEDFSFFLLFIIKSGVRSFNCSISNVLALFSTHFLSSFSINVFVNKLMDVWCMVNWVKVFARDVHWGGKFNFLFSRIVFFIPRSLRLVALNLAFNDFHQTHSRRLLNLFYWILSPKDMLKLNSLGGIHLSLSNLVSL